MVADMLKVWYRTMRDLDLAAPVQPGAPSTIRALYEPGLPFGRDQIRNYMPKRPNYTHTISGKQIKKRFMANGLF